MPLLTKSTCYVKMLKESSGLGMYYFPGCFIEAQSTHTLRHYLQDDCLNEKMRKSNASNFSLLTITSLSFETIVWRMYLASGFALHRDSRCLKIWSSASPWAVEGEISTSSTPQLFQSKFFIRLYSLSMKGVPGRIAVQVIPSVGASSGTPSKAMKRVRAIVILIKRTNNNNKNVMNWKQKNWKQWLI